MIVISLLFFFDLRARESFELALGKGDKVRIWADKGYIRLRQNVREVVGNVIITYGTNAVYGEKASVAPDVGEVNVIGNVRYVAPEITLYGSHLFLNFHDGSMKIKNARILTESFVVLGKELSRVEENVFVGDDAEYTTCQDCPESWSISGKKIHVTVGQYIRVWHAQIKINGTVIMYIPYIVLPIKQKRETGLLFPSMNMVKDEGFWIRQPFFWAISPHNDLTFAPAMLGSRGWGSEIQYRHVLGEEKWFDLNTLNVSDRIYEPYKEAKTLSGKKVFRHFTEYEHHFSFGNNINHHFIYTDAKDLDVVRDFDYHTKNRILGAEMTRGGFFDYRLPLFDVNAQVYYNRNLLTGSPRRFDNSYVQLLPQISFSSVPLSLFSSNIPLLNNISAGIEGDIAIFKQNNLNEGNYIRNARRFNFQPYVDWFLGSIGPVNFKTNLTFDYQDYYFPYERTENSFSKHAIVNESEASIAFSRIFGLARKEYRPVADVIANEGSGSEKIIGDLPSFKKQYARDKVGIIHQSYKHHQVLKVKHYFIGGDRARGSSKFAQQIESDAGIFDYLDPIRGTEYQLSHAAFKTSLPLNNTVELQWNNTLIRKTPLEFDVFQEGRFLKDNFHYGTISYLNVSQGYDLKAAETEDFRDSLTRLNVSFGFNWETFSISMQEYYFYSNRGNILSLDMKKSFSFAHVHVGLIYDSFSLPVNKYVTLGASIRPSDMLEFSVRYAYDIERKLDRQSEYNLLYSPLSRCWQINFRRSQSELDLGARYSFNLVINFDGNTHSSLVEDAR